jgi:chondroitin AC lyase
MKAHEQDTVDIIRERIVHSLLSDSPSPALPKQLAQMLPDGSWADIAYDDPAMGSWAPMGHLQRLREAAVAYRQEGHVLFQKAEVIDVITRGLRYGFARNPVSRNWWFNQIGKPHALARIGLLLHDVLRPEELERIIRELATEPCFTGANRTWITQQIVWRGILARELALIRKGLADLADTLRLTDAEGVQVDGSFHQHGAQLYNGSYGQSFLADAVTWAELVRATEFAFGEEQLELLRFLMLEGNRWMIRGPFFDLSACGRTITRPGVSSRMFAGVLDSLAELQPRHAGDYLTLARHIRGEGAPPVWGNRFFHRSDFMVQQQEGFYLSVKMCSARTWGTECGNGENLKGRWLPYGLTWIVRHGNEYGDVLPCMDWSILPGVTGTADTHFPRLTGDWWTQGTRFVGGVSNGRQGVAAMVMDGDLLHGIPRVRGNVLTERGHLQGDDIEMEIQVHRGELVQARKAYFLFDQELVALGTDLHSPGGMPVKTGVNQTLLQGDVVVDGSVRGRGTHELDGVRRVWHDGVGYVFPEGSSVRLSSLCQIGSWKDINTNYPGDPVARDVFKLWIEHGVPGVATAYQYIVRPGVDLPAFEAYAAALPVRVLSNAPRLQAVAQVATGVTGAVFYEPGSLHLPSGKWVEVDQPVALLLEEGAGGTVLTLSSPEQKTGTVRVALSVPDGSGTPRKRTWNLPLPAGNHAGSSVNVEME